MQSDSLRIVKNSTYQGVAFGFKGLAAVGVAVIIGRFHGPALLGNYAAVMTIVSLLAFFSAFGQPDLLTRELARCRDTREFGWHVSSALLVVVLLSALAMAGIFAAAAMLGLATVSARALIYAGIALALDSVTTVVLSMFRAIEELQRVALVVIVVEGAFLGLNVLLLSANVSLEEILVALVAARALGLVLAAGLAGQRFGRGIAAPDPHRAGQLIRQGLPFAANRAMGEAYARLDVLVLTAVSGSLVVGLYAAATSLTLRVNIAFRSVNQALYPFLAKLYVRESGAVLPYVLRAIRGLLIPAGVLAIGLMVYRHDAIAWLYGPAFAPSAQVLLWLAPLIPVRMVTSALGTTLSATDRQGARASLMTLAVVAKLALSVVLVTRYQLMGAVYANLATEGVLLVAMMLVLREQWMHPVDQVHERESRASLESDTER